MIKTDKVKGNVFVEQTTYYLYASEEDRANDKHVFCGSDKKEFEAIKKRIEEGEPITSKGFSL